MFGSCEFEQCEIRGVVGSGVDKLEFVKDGLLEMRIGLRREVRVSFACKSVSGVQICVVTTG